jgi:anti-anti-sigma regulatory factor
MPDVSPSGSADDIELSVSLAHTHLDVRVFVRGRLTCETIETLERFIDEHDCFSHPELIIDLSGVVEVDGVGASVLAGIRFYAAARSSLLIYEGARPPVAQAIEASASALGITPLRSRQTRLGCPPKTSAPNPSPWGTV